MADIRTATETDLDTVLTVERAAFGSDEEAGLVRSLLADPSAEPCLSLLAWEGDQAVGHILFTAAQIEGATASLLAPLAIIPSHQKQGIGQALIREGVKQLGDQGVDLVFVLGHIEYYPRAGFEPAKPHGLNAPHPIPDEVADAWMVQELRSGILGTVQGTLKCADAISAEEYWRE